MKNFCFLAIILMGLAACQNEEHSVPIPDVTDIRTDFRLVLYDSLLAEIDTNDIAATFAPVAEQFPEFTELYFTRIVPITEPPVAYDDSFHLALRDFLTDRRIRYLLDTVHQVFPDFRGNFQTKLETAFKNIKYYFPNYRAPNAYTLISEYAYQNFLFLDGGGKDGLGIGLDMYLGREFPYKRINPQSPSFSDYLTRTFDKGHLVSKSIKAVIDDIAGPPGGGRMLDQMIHNGKKLYILQRVLPATPDSVIIEYTSQQMDWVDNNQEEMWAFFFREELFYETNMMKINKYISTSPNSPGMPPQAPGKTANYMGWQIVRAYMERYPQTSLIDLLQMEDAQQLLDAARFKPRRKN